MTGAKPKWEQGKRIGLVYSMGVRADKRGCGGASLLLARAEQELQQRWGILEAQLCVEVHNQHAKAFYRHKGYEVFKHQPNAFQLQGVPHDIQMMRKSFA